MSAQMDSNDTTTGRNGEGNEADDRRDTRNRVLLAVLYRQLLNYRRRRASTRSNRNENYDINFDSSDDEEDEIPQQPVRPLRILSDQEAQSLEAVCRFCFEGAEPEVVNQDDDNEGMPDNGEEDRRLVAACACTGSSEYVHIFCLRQWQMQARNNGRHSASVCRVCTTPYALPPPPPRSLRPIPKGTLLISQHDMDVGIFGRSVVLLLSGTDDPDELPFGLIINKPMDSTLALPQSTRTTAVRVGGPVCGGRLGVVQYMILYSKEVNRQDDHKNNHDDDDDALMDERWSFSDPIMANETSQLCLLNDEDNVYDRESPALLETTDVAEFLLHQDMQNCSSQSDNSSPQPPPSSNAIVFAGFCRWGRGQLEGEIQQGDIWDLARGRMEDITNTAASGSSSNLWNMLQPGGASHNRVLSDRELYRQETYIPVVSAHVEMEQEEVE